MRGWRETNSDSDWDFIWAERYHNVVCAVSSCVRASPGSPVFLMYGERGLGARYLVQKEWTRDVCGGRVGYQVLLVGQAVRIQLVRISSSSRYSNLYCIRTAVDMDLLSYVASTTDHIAFSSVVVREEGRLSCRVTQSMRQASFTYCTCHAERPSRVITCPTVLNGTSYTDDRQQEMPLVRYSTAGQKHCLSICCRIPR